MLVFYSKGIKMAAIIKESVTEIEYKKLMTYLRGDESIKENTRINLMRTFTLLFYTGARLNELLQLTNSDILEILSKQELIIKTHKTNPLRRVYTSQQSPCEI